MEAMLDALEAVHNSFPLHPDVKLFQATIHLLAICREHGVPEDEIKVIYRDAFAECQRRWRLSMGLPEYPPVTLPRLPASKPLAAHARPLPKWCLR
jgi:hypothetical protein